MATKTKLEEYVRRRNFERTPEPAADARPRRSGRLGGFVVQQHAARRMHYDFRLEHDGVLKSWAVPKGPSLDTRERRMAVQTEDHPLAYASFEGTIPKGEYGGGTVLVWDRGSWEPIGDASAGLAKGKLEFRLAGEKLRGRWHLVRMRARREDRGKPVWLLIKGRDEQARTGAEAAITDREPTSVLSGRTLGAVGEDPERVWSSLTGERKVPKSERKTTKKTARPRASAQTVAAAPPLRAEVAGVRLSSPDRVYFPDVGVTKSELAQYYETMAERVLPGLAGRPLSLVRCPEGIAKKCFYQKHAGDTVPDRVARVTVRKGEEPYAMVTDLASLISLVQIAVLELHVWGARGDRLDNPDLFVLDLDPDPSVPWERLKATAQLLKLLLEDLGFVPFLRTTGGKGLHVVVPLVRRSSWEEVKSFTRDVARFLVREAPAHYTAEIPKAKRKGKILIDYLRNDRESTAIASYSVRARPGAPVAMPLAWEELEGADELPVFGLREAPARLALPDPWREFEHSRRALGARARERLAAV